MEFVCRYSGRSADSLKDCLALEDSYCLELFNEMGKIKKCHPKTVPLTTLFFMWHATVKAWMQLISKENIEDNKNLTNV